MRAKKFESVSDNFLPKWVLASSLGMAAGLAIAYVVFSILGGLGVHVNDWLFTLLLLPLVGSTVGLLQSFVLRRYGVSPLLWFVATLVGYALCILVLVVFNEWITIRTGYLDDMLILTMVGSVIGTSQWLIIRNHGRKAMWLILATIFGFMGQLLVIANPAKTSMQFIGYIALEGAFIGITTGLVLMNIFKDNTLPAKPTA